ncbi:2OG-Fe(II) oxygenase family protein [Candidatus Pelagibacter sp.]|nr:2OG-Fe(II) oxygenase family protein [Candidatus Pelagibacter sp.]
MKNIKPFGPSIGRTKISKKLFEVLNKEFDEKSKSKKIDYSSKLASQIKKELKISNKFIMKYLDKELKKNIFKFLSNEKIKKIKKIKILNLWVVRQFKGEYNPIHYHEGDLSGVGYLKLPKNMVHNKILKNKKIKTNGTIDFINGQKGFLSKSIYNVVPKIKELIIFPNYLLHTAYPFNIEGERRSFSFNAKIFFKNK